MSRQMDLEDRLFWVAKEDEVRQAETTDIYFRYALETLRGSGLNPSVIMEVYARGLPFPGDWGVVTGIYEVAKLLEGLPINADAMEEGELFLVSDVSVAHEPVLQIDGPYAEFICHENPILGLLCKSSGISTKAARVKMAAGGRAVLSFGTRRTHPALAPTVERATYIGGFDHVSNVLGARLMGKRPMGTMPHALIQCFGEQEKAWLAFDRTMPTSVPRIALIDTFSDEKDEAIRALEVMKDKLYGVRIDTPSSRRGDLRKIVEEVRWELKIRGGGHVKIFVSGGLDEASVRELRDLVDGFGVGTSVSDAPGIDFSAKIVSLQENGKETFRSKRGDIAGRKQVYRNWDSFQDIVMLGGNSGPEGCEPLLKPLIRNGKIVRKIRSVDDIRKGVLTKLHRLSEVTPELTLA